jgi:hypothetical protein
MTFVRFSYRITCVALLIAGIAMATQVSPRYTPVAAQRVPERDGNSGLDKVGGTSEIDVSELYVHLDELRFDEWPEQIADWVVLGVLSDSNLDADTLRAALFDKPQMRFPELEEIFTFDYGRGRRVLLPDRQVWLFYSDTDPAPRATLARLADKVRMETQELPAHFRVFRYRSNLTDGIIEVTREPDIESTRMFSAEYGYLESEISSLADLDAWLASVDDVTYIAKVGRAFAIGGRRFEQHRTANLKLEDVAALYQAHVSLVARGGEAEKKMRQELSPLTEPFDSLVDLYNARERRVNDIFSDRREPTFAPAELTAFMRSANELVRVVREGLAGEDMSGLPPVNDNLAHLLLARTFVEVIEPFVQRAIEKRRIEVLRDMATRGELPPDAPGFSLDPQWNVPGLVADLTLLIEDPEQVVAMAREVARQKALHDESATPILVWAADDVASMFPRDRRFNLQATWKNQLGAIIRGVRGKSGIKAEKGALVGYYRLHDDLERISNRRPTEVTQADRVRALLRFIEARNLMQCARYDGSLQGTPVGMNLFYTDLVAKLWAGVDYHRSAPVEQVHGYLSIPRFGPSLGPAFWEESLQLPSTRLWFGPRDEGYSTTPDVDRVYFAHLGARVYSAGSNPIFPGEESIANESSRRVFGWWNRHFEHVADFEPQYHVLNQNMKWSILTGWLLESDRAGFLGKVAVQKGLRFDHWMSQSNGLTLKHQVPFIPEDGWISGTECIEILRSYPFPSQGRTGIISGGVSLGSLHTLGKGRQVNRSRGYSFRRAGVDHEHSTSDSIHTLGGSKVELSRAPSGAPRAKLQPASGARMRGHGRFEAKLGNIVTQFVPREREFQLETLSDAGAMGSMTARKTNRGVKLTWQDDAVAHDKRFTTKLSELVSAREMDAGQIASDAEFAPARGLYVVEPRHGNPYVLRVAPGPEATNPSASGSARIYEVGPKVGNDKSSHIDPDAVLLTSAGHREQLTGKVVGKTIELTTVVKRSEVKAAVTSADHVQKLLEAAPWQRLQVHGEHADAITRVFSSRGPPPGSRRITIETGDPSLPRVQAYASEDALYLERPANAAAHKIFNDFVTTREVTGSGLRELIETADRGASTYALQAQHMPAMPQGPVQRAFDGDYKPLLRELRSAAQRGTLDQALLDVYELSRQHTVSNLRSGRKITGARHYLGRDYQHHSVDATMARALVNIQDRALDAAARDVHAIAMRSDLTAARARRMAEELEPSSDAAADYLRAQKGLLPDVSRDLSAHLSLAASRSRVRMVLDVDAWKGKHAPWSEISDARKVELIDELRSNGARVYLGPDAYLHRMPWDEAPGPTLAQVAADTRYQWTELDGLPLGVTRANDLIADGARYKGFDIPAEQPRPQPRVMSPRIIRIQARYAANGNQCNPGEGSCDLDCDGQVTSSEQQRCAAR